MSTGINIFFQSSNAAPLVVAALESLLEIQFTHETDDELTRYVYDALGVRIILFADHGLVDDMGIPFSSYPYEMDIEVSRQCIDRAIADKFHESLSLYLFARITVQLGWRSIAVINLQKVIAKWDGEPI